MGVQTQIHGAKNKFRWTWTNWDFFVHQYSSFTHLKPISLPIDYFFYGRRENAPTFVSNQQWSLQSNPILPLIKKYFSNFPSSYCFWLCPTSTISPNFNCLPQDALTQLLNFFLHPNQMSDNDKMPPSIDAFQAISIDTAMICQNFVRLNNPKPLRDFIDFVPKIPDNLNKQIESTRLAIKVSFKCWLMWMGSRCLSVRHPFWM